MLKALKAGSARVTVSARDGGAKAVLNITVTKKKKTNRILKAARTSLTLKPGQNTSFLFRKITAKTTEPVTYRSSDRRIADTDRYGTIYGKKKGTVKIKASCGKKSAVMTVRVK